jgi:adenosylcobinamide-GDP ribazoletransferase
MGFPGAFRAFIRHYLLAVQFFTRIPVTGRLAAWTGFSPTMLRASAAHFPGVGWIAGAAACAVYALAAWLWGGGAFVPLAAAAASTVTTVLLTGAFHEDGLADVADGLGATHDPARALDIMKDSRIGAFGALALVLALLSKLALLAVLGAHGTPTVLAALAGAHVLSRFWPLLVVRSLPHVGDAARSKSKPLADRIGGGALLAAAAWCLPPLALVAYAQGLVFLAAAALASGGALAWMHRLFARRLGGFTGDCLGAAQQVCEIAFYAGAAAALR